MSNHPQISTLGELKKSNWKSRSVKEELRQNLISNLKNKVDVFDGIRGYDKTVIPQIYNAILSQHDIILLGLRGQAKTRILRSLPKLLDEYCPYVDGTELREDPYQPISKKAIKLISEMGDQTPIAWMHRSERYVEKLATPDTSVADLIGDIDPIKAANEKLNLSDEEIINYGLIPRANRGIFTINELPDLQPRIQVALLNIMQERDIQIRGFNIRIPLDISVTFSANPEDYTNRGNIITPLKDRIDSQIITHYPKDLEVGLTITEQEARVSRDGVTVEVPYFIKEIIEQIAFEARNSEFVDQKSGVSARMTITAMEQVVAAAERRAVLNGEEKEILVRMCDLYHCIPALTGKLELVYEGEQEGARNVAIHLIGKATNVIFKEYFPDPRSKKAEKNSYEDIIRWFAGGNTLEISDSMKNAVYVNQLHKVKGLEKLVSGLHQPNSKYELTVMMDFLVEALHQNSMLGKEDLDDSITYTDMVGSMLGQIGKFDDESDEDYFN